MKGKKNNKEEKVEVLCRRRQEVLPKGWCKWKQANKCKIHPGVDGPQLANSYVHLIKVKVPRKAPIEKAQRCA